jgi:hypothetical protein
MRTSPLFVTLKMVDVTTNHNTDTFWARMLRPNLRTRHSYIYPSDPNVYVQCDSHGFVTALSVKDASVNTGTPVSSWADESNMRTIQFTRRIPTCPPTAGAIRYERRIQGRNFQAASPSQLRIVYFDGQSSGPIQSIYIQEPNSHRPRSPLMWSSGEEECGDESGGDSEEDGDNGSIL